MFFLRKIARQCAEAITLLRRASSRLATRLDLGTEET